jgi:hypothetical protein
MKTSLIMLSVVNMALAVANFVCLFFAPHPMNVVAAIICPIAAFSCLRTALE